MRSMAVGALAAFCICLAFPNVAVAQEAKTDSPCSDPEFSQFDFWVGEWRMSRDGGTTWNEAFVGLYTRRE